VIAPIHDRMAVILPREGHEAWLDPGFGDTEKLAALLVRFPANEVKAYPVSTLVNIARVEDARGAYGRWRGKRRGVARCLFRRARMWDRGGVEAHPAQRSTVESSTALRSSCLQQGRWLSHKRRRLPGDGWPMLSTRLRPSRIQT
jgi:hypothetical protein